MFAHEVLVPRWLLLLVGTCMALIMAASIFTLGLSAARADVPDATPSTPDPSHTFYGCTAAGPSPSQRYAPLYALDKDVPPGTCPNGWTEVRLVPAAVP